MNSRSSNDRRAFHPGPAALRGAVPHANQPKALPGTKCPTVSSDERNSQILRRPSIAARCPVDYAARVMQAAAAGNTHAHASRRLLAARRSDQLMGGRRGSPSGLPGTAWPDSASAEFGATEETAMRGTTDIATGRHPHVHEPPLQHETCSVLDEPASRESLAFFCPAQCSKPGVAAPGA